jgi:hypothetical protein
MAILIQATRPLFIRKKKTHCSALEFCGSDYERLASSSLMRHAKLGIAATFCSIAMLM